MKSINTKVDADFIVETIHQTKMDLQKLRIKQKANKILNFLIEIIEQVDFKKYVGYENQNQKLYKKHYLVSIIEILFEIIKENGFDIGVKNSNIYLFNGQYWENIDSETIKNFLGKVALKMKVNKFDAKLHSFKDELYKQFLAESYINDISKTDNDITLINFSNGTFEISLKHQFLREFRKEDFTTYILPFEYDEKAHSPLFDKFLDEVLPEKELQQIISEYLGYVFIKNQTLKLEKVLILYGTGANGKSVFFEIINHIFGKENVSNYTLESLTNSAGYERAMIGNKLLNYASEVNRKIETHFFKMLISGEPVQVRLPYEKPYIMTNYAKFIFNTNELPREIENTNAFYRRFIIIPFKISIPEEKQDVELAKKIIENELSGVFNWILSGMKNLLKNKRFTQSKIVTNEVQNFRKENDSVLMFVAEQQYQQSQDYILLKNLYAEYKQFCIEYGFRAVSVKKFSKRLENKGFSKERISSGIVFYINK